MLKIQDLSFRVDNDGQDKEIIQNINLEIPAGKLFVITGPNGGGSSRSSSPSSSRESACLTSSVWLQAKS